MAYAERRDLVDCGEEIRMHQPSTNNLGEMNSFANILRAPKIETIHIDSFVDIQVRDCDSDVSFQEPFDSWDTSEVEPTNEGIHLQKCTR